MIFLFNFKENIVEKTRKGWLPAFSIFTNKVFNSLWLCILNPLPNQPWFLRVGCTSLLKTLREKEKLLVKSNFSFSHSVFYQSRDLSAIFIKFETVICKLFEFGRVHNLSFEKGLNNYWFKGILLHFRHYLTLYHTAKFCTGHNKCEWNTEFVLGRVENIVGKGENAGYQPFLLFPKCFFKRLSLPGRKKSGSCGKELSHILVTAQILHMSWVSLKFQ